MHIEISQPEFPSEDKRWKRVNATMRKYGYKPHALIETLHTVQELFGFLDEDAFNFVARGLRVPYSKIYGVATFYHFFNLKPKGDHTCVLCTGTACYIKGIPGILEAVETKHGLKPDETTPDNKVSLLTARCVGACGLAPVVVYDNEVVGYQQPEDVEKRITAWRES